MTKDLFHEVTGKFQAGDDLKTIKKAAIDAKRSVPILKVGDKTKSLSNKLFGIGRSKDNQLIISDPMVSKFHAMVLFENGNSYIKDTNSSNGTFLNGNPLVSGKKYLLKNGDKIKMGQTVINFFI